MAKVIVRISWYQRKIKNQSWEIFLKMDPQHLRHVEVLTLNGFDRFELFTKLSPVTLRKPFYASLFLNNLMKKALVINN